MSGTTRNGLMYDTAVADDKRRVVDPSHKHLRLRIIFYVTMHQHVGIVAVRGLISRLYVTFTGPPVSVCAQRHILLRSVLKGRALVFHTMRL